MVKITGYRIFRSTGGNKCVQCKTRMRKGLPYLSPVTGKNVVRELKGKSICISCIQELTDNIDEKMNGEEDSLKKYEQRRFLEHLK